MHDIFDPKLTAQATDRTLVPVTYIQTPARNNAFTIARSTDRAFFKSGVSMLTDLELLDTRRDHLHHRNSGLDTTDANLCRTHNVLVGINLANLRTKDPIIMGRVMQNIALCKKHKVRMTVFTNAQTTDELASPHDIESLLRVLGMDTKQASETMQNLEHAYKEVLLRASGAIIKKGVRRAD